MTPSPALSAQDYAELSELFDRLSELDPAPRAQRLQALQAQGHPLADRLARMLAALQGPRTEGLLPLVQARAGAVPAAPSALAAGQRIGPWRLLQPLGQGGMAEVWLAVRDDGGLKREVALKLPAPVAGAAGQARAQRFARERDILASLRHPHIAALLDAGVEADGQAWLALERVDGQRITDWCDQQRTPLRQRVQLFRQVLLAVQQAHAQLVIHRDLKPANVLVNQQGEVRLLDFGIAKLLAEGQPQVEDTALTQQAGRPLTPRYASPEQLLGQPLSTASDVYALGVLLHELLTGRLPYTLNQDTAAELERAIVEREVPVPSRTRPGDVQAVAGGCTPRALQRALAPELDAVLLRALAKRPADRYRSVDALLDDIERWLDGVPVRARRPSPWFRLRRFVARHPLAVGSAAAAAAALAGLSLTATLLGLQAREEAQRVQLSRDFLLEMFRRADVDQSRGADISARELLAWGRQHAATLPEQPALRAELLLDIGRAQLEASDYAGAELSLAQALPLLQQLGRREAALLAQAQRTEVALRLGDLERAAALLQAARDLQPPAPGPAVVARLAQLGGWLALLRGDRAGAARLDDEAAEAAARAWPAGDDRRVQIQLNQARSRAELGQAQAALGLLDSLLVQLDSAAGVDARQRANVEFTRAAVEVGMGRYGSVASRLQPGTARCAAEIGARAEICGRLRRLLALALLRTGDQPAAEALLAAIHDELASTDNPTRRAEALLIAGRIAAGRGPIDEAATPWPELLAIAQDRAGAPLPEHLPVLAQQVLAEGLLRSAQPARAWPWITAARQRLAEGGLDQPPLVLRAEVLAGAAQWLQGRPQEALATWEQAQHLAERSLGAQHPLTWLYALNRVPALQAVGQAARAQDLLDQGLPLLREALGPRAPHLQTVAGWPRGPGPARPAAGQDLLL